MIKFVFFSLALFIYSFSAAHPGIGIVIDDNGNIYYTDLRQVWKLTPDGKKSIVVPNVHTHELYLDQEGNLFGEHLWYNGEKLNTWGHYVWNLKNSGELVKETRHLEGFLDNYSFVRDSSGNMYWVERFIVSRFMKKSPDGKISLLAKGKFGFIGWINAATDGTIFFTENNKLHKLSPDGNFSLLAEDLGSKTTSFSIMGNHYSGYGIWTDVAGNIYIAMIDSKKINRISPGGAVQTIYRSNSYWTTCNGLFDRDGNLWLLENSITNEVRVRKISKEEMDGMSKPVNYAVNKIHLLITILTGTTAIIFYWLLRRMLYKKK